MTSAILDPIQPTTMTPKTEVVDALNQLISLVAGRNAAIATNALSDKPDERIREITTLITSELLTATTTGDMKGLKQLQRKVESLQSLKVLSTVLLSEVEWD